MKIGTAFNKKVLAWGFNCSIFENEKENSENLTKYFQNLSSKNLTQKLILY